MIYVSSESETNALLMTAVTSVDDLSLSSVLTLFFHLSDMPNCNFRLFWFCGFTSQSSCRQSHGSLGAVELDQTKGASGGQFWRDRVEFLLVRRPS